MLFRVERIRQGIRVAIAKGYRSSSGKENVLKLTVTHIFEYTKKYCIVHFKCISFIVCEI